MTKTPQCPVCGNSANGAITITANCTAKVYQDSFDYSNCSVGRTSATQCDECLYCAPYSEFESGFKPLGSAELDALITFLGEVATQHKTLKGEHMAKRCIGQLLYHNRYSAPATAGDN
jgi:hypothetical protein